MKHTLFLLLLPCVGFAQQAITDIKGSKPFLVVHFNKLKMATGDASSGKDDCNRLTIYDGDFLLTDTLPANELSLKPNDKRLSPTCIVDQVAIEYNNSQILKGDRLEYDGARKKGILRGHVRYSKNGVDEPLGRYALLDLSDNRYRIEKLR